MRLTRFAQLANFQREHLEIPAGVERQLVVGEHIGAALRRREVRQDDARHLVEAEQMRRRAAVHDEAEHQRADMPPRGGRYDTGAGCGDQVARGISKFYGGRPVVRDFSARIMRGDRVGIVGPNGAGKTTLLNLLTGALMPDIGEVRLGTNLAPVILDQRRETLDPEQSLTEALTGGSGDTVTVGGQSRHVIGYMKDFLFRRDQARTPVSVLSGGERARLTLARAFARPSNLLVLDEPTNDLDLETLDLLQERLAEYPGTVLLVSHDRDFLDRVVTSVIATEGDGRWIEYAGGYTDMLAQREPAGRRTLPSRVSGAKRPRPVTEIRAQPPARPRRISFNDRRALEMLPARIAELQTQITGLNALLADPDLYARDPGRFVATSQALAIARDELAAAEEQWLTLEMLREQIDDDERKS